VTHCDIKVANLLVDTSLDKEKGRPILVDFGFATLHDHKTNFKSKQSWGTP
jgi:serine/threonine protein kinase